MRQTTRKRRGEVTPARRAGNLLMIAGVVTPVIGIAITKFVTFDFEIYRRVIQAVFIAGLLIFVGGLLVKNYWKSGKAEERYDPTGLWSNASCSVPEEQQFDWTGIGCALLVLGPGIFFIVGFLFAQEFEYGAVVGFVSVVLCIVVGSKLFNLGRAKRRSVERAADALHSEIGQSEDGPSSAREDLPDIATPLPVRDGFVLVDGSEGVTYGIPILGAFTAIWYVATFFFIFMVLMFGGENAGLAMAVLSLFLLAGLMPLYFLIRLVKMAAAFEKRAELLLSHWPLESGDDVDMTFQCNLKKALTVMSMDVTLECQNIDSSGSETQTSMVDMRTLSVRDFKQQDKQITGKWVISMPTTWTLPYKRGTEELNWKLHVVVPVAEGPKGVFNFPLQVVHGHNVEAGEA